MSTKGSYWKQYFDQETVARAEEIRRSEAVQSTGVDLHVDLFIQPEPDAPVFIFNHGGGGYSRLFTPLALALYDRGYTVLLPDQYAQGLSGGDWRELTFGKCVQNLVDAARWARERFAGPLFMGGGSLGGGLTYYAAAAGAPVDGIVCHNLYRFDRAGDALALSRFAGLTAVPGLPALLGGVTAALARLLPRLPLPYGLLARFERMVDPRDTGFYVRWQADPAPLRRIPLQYMHSMMRTGMGRPLAANELPVLVINPVQDEMVDPAVTRRNYDELGGPKRYVELPYGHWAMSAGFVAAWVAAVDEFVVTASAVS